MLELLVLPSIVLIACTIGIVIWMRGPSDHMSMRIADRFRSWRREVQIRVLIGAVSLWASAACGGLLVIGFGQADEAPGAASFGILVIIFVTVASALAYFGWVIVSVLFLTSTDRTFDSDARLLLGETALSVLLTISVGATLLMWQGVNPPAQEGLPLDGWDYLYVSAVTFSTLGYGDFSPLPAARAFAALLAILGNLHLGLFVGTVLVMFKPKADRPAREGNTG